MEIREGVRHIMTKRLVGLCRAEVRLAAIRREFMRHWRLRSSEYLPDWVAKILIGAINAAIIAVNTPEPQAAVLPLTEHRTLKNTRPPRRLGALGRLNRTGLAARIGRADDVAACRSNCVIRPDWCGVVSGTITELSWADGSRCPPPSAQTKKYPSPLGISRSQNGFLCMSRPGGINVAR
jgi:hypothetical protein